MCGLMTMLRMWIFCLMMACDVTSCLHHVFVFSIVMFVCNFHLSEGTRYMPKYLEATFWDRVEMGLYVGFEYIWFEFRFVGASGDGAFG